MRRPWTVPPVVTFIALTAILRADDRPPKVEVSTAARELHQVVYFSAKRGAQWLKSAQRPDGLFVYGWQPALNKPLPGENHLRQAGAAAALARAASASGDPELALSARQAILLLLSSFTEPDPDQPDARRPTLPPAEANPVGFTALLLWAITELPSPNPSLVEQGEKLAKFLASRQRADGSINVSSGFDPHAEDSVEDVDFYPGEALYSIARSHLMQPQPWKLDVLNKAFPFYEARFAQHRSAPFIPWQSAAFAEGYLLTKNERWANFVFAMNDWLVTLQYVEAPTTPTEWLGGFAAWDGERLLRVPPGASTSSYSEALAEACRVARLKGDADRWRVYQQSLVRSISFLMSQQYTVSNTTHFERWFSKKLHGGFWASVDDGHLRIDFTQHAVCAMLQFLNGVEFENPDIAKRRVPPNAPRAN